MRPLAVTSDSTRDTYNHCSLRPLFARTKFALLDRSGTTSIETAKAVTKMLRWLFLLALQCVLIASWPVSPADDIDSLDSPTYLTHNLTRRQCVRRTAGVDNFECDFKLPTLVDIIARFRDPAYGGISSTTSAVFYTNLAYPEFAIKNVPHLRWIALWLVGTGRYSTAYSNFHNVDQICKWSSRRRIPTPGFR